MLASKCQKSINMIERELGYPRNALHNYKNGTEPPASRVLELAQYFGVSPYYLIDKEKVSENTKNIEFYFEKLTVQQKKELYLICEAWFISLL